MTKPSYKAPELETFLNDFLNVNRVETIKDDKCVSCNNIAMLFRDDISKKEYTISGLCQDCQDSVFGVEEFEDEDYEGSIN
jgi:hypothetical protein